MSRSMPFSLLLLLATLGWLAGCGGGNTGSNNPFANAVNPIGGVMNAAAFSIPAGATRTATSDLAVTTTDSLTIDGTLVVEPGVSVSLYSDGPVTINGAIQAAPGAAFTRGRGGESTLNISGSTVTTNTNVQAPTPGQSVNITVERADGTVYLNGDLATLEGIAGKNNTQNGGNSGDINIGGVAALSQAKAAGRANACTPQIIKIGGALSTGMGGKGFSDNTGTLIGTTLTAKGTNGGNAGKITLAATGKIILTGATVNAGYGGFGGYVGGYLAPPSGVLPNSAGDNLMATSGSGGNGGSVIISAPQVIDGDGVGQAGGKGHAGYLQIKGGDGGPGGDGGNITIRLGLPGQDGTGPVLPAALGEPKGFISLGGGGNGKAGWQSGMKGGVGGSVDILGVDGNPAQTSDPVFFDLCCNGGNGFDGSKTVPMTAGGNGGDGGHLTIHGVAYTHSNSFNGGNCGNGQPSGNMGGNAGKDDAGTQIGFSGV